jgi:hypothetical protein
MEAQVGPAASDRRLLGAVISQNPVPVADLSTLISRCSMSAGGVQHGRHIRAHLLGDQPPRADLPLHVQPAAADHNHRHGLAAAWHQHLPGEVSLIMI